MRSWTNNVASSAVISTKNQMYMYNIERVIFVINASLYERYVRIQLILTFIFKHFNLVIRADILNTQFYNWHQII